MKVKLVTLIVVCFCSLILPTKLYAFADLDSICLYIAEDNKKRLRKTLKKSHVKMRSLFKDMSCNELSLLQFAIQRKAKNVGLFIVKKVPVSTLKKSGVLQWIEENGYSDSEITAALLKRVGG